MCLVDGVGTELLRRKLATGSLTASHADRCFSLVTTSESLLLERRAATHVALAPTGDRMLLPLLAHAWLAARTFDLEANSIAQRKVLVRALGFLVNHLARPAGGSTSTTVAARHTSSANGGNVIGAAGYTIY